MLSEREADQSHPNNIRLKMPSTYLIVLMLGQRVFIIVYLSVEQSRSVCLQVPSILWKPKAHYCIHKGPTLYLILSR
jgi:hypothetical protein